MFLKKNFLFRFFFMFFVSNGHLTLLTALRGNNQANQNNVLQTNKWKL